jgi:hypothetical protein
MRRRWYRSHWLDIGTTVSPGEKDWEEKSQNKQLRQEPGSPFTAVLYAASEGMATGAKKGPILVRKWQSSFDFENPLPI